ncbi:hypothetical protein, partial [Pseudomonas sp. FW305-122]|uniref:hypothetical protein n=1 Tax=Pseudomonas sp. FW305-122 TaxID=2070561 RepID=UPI001C4699FB
VHTLRGDVLFGPVNDFSDLSKFHIVTKGYESTIKVGEHEVSSPKQFPLDEYLKSINSQIFSPLATRESGAFAPRSANNLSSPLKVSPSKENAIAARKKESSSKESTAGEPN